MDDSQDKFAGHGMPCPYEEDGKDVRKAKRAAHEMQCAALSHFDSFC